MKRDKKLTAADAEKSVKLRPLLAVVAWEMFKDRPIAGHGLGRYEQEQGSAFTPIAATACRLEQARNYVQHNVFLSVLVDTGLIGFGLVLSWLTMIAGTGLVGGSQFASQTGDAIRRPADARNDDSIRVQWDVS